MPLKDAYLESQVMTADPLELVRLLYRGAADATRAAQAHLATGRIADRSRQISKAHAILSQLSVSLDHAQGGALSQRLSELYDYMQRRLLEANLHQQAEPLAEVEKLLATLLAGWEGIGKTVESNASRGDAARQGGPAEYGGVAGYPGFLGAGSPVEHASQSWSF